ncbi:ABC transporter ATP-binding protein [Chitinophaga sp.]|uniref:ABC transporter ATP-binding protein n=1 Tax=Chitinophaga sp. TaxID=1869181 RepID=UPI002634DCE9|nr:ABC transporter ATP-binding protein [uncultured Chitinophaga sp.]
MESILKVENLSHRYTSTWAIRDINFQIERHGVVGLLGSNGAGKSTTMNIIAGVLSQTEGTVLINGIDKQKDRLLAKRQLGFLPQTPPLHMDFTVREYLTYAAGLRYVEKKHIPKSVDIAMDKCGIAHFSHRLIRNLSGGYRQRVGIAQSIIHNPALVIMDEPTNGLDPNQIIEARKLIREIGEQHTVLLSSHVLNEISILCRDIIMIEGGRIVFSDSMDAFNNYLKPQSVLMHMDQMPAEHALKAIEGVQRVQYLSNRQCRVYFTGGAEITERLIAASVRENWRLQEIQLEKSLLDDVFKQLSTQNKRVN